jgi:hypothetical protein
MVGASNLTYSDTWRQAIFRWQSFDAPLAPDKRFVRLSSAKKEGA